MNRLLLAAPGRRGALSLLLALLLACGGDPPPADPEAAAAPVPAGPQATPTVPTVPVPENPEVGVVIMPGAELVYPDPMTVAELEAGYPAALLLTPPDKKLLVAVLNSVPAPCGPCEGQSLGRCAVQPAPRCENVPGLVARAQALLQRGEAPMRVRETILYSDIWVPLPDNRKPWPTTTGPVRVEVWLDPASAFLTPAVEVLRRLPLDRANIVTRFLVDPNNPSGAEVAKGAIAAEAQGMGLEFLLQARLWREGQREVLRRGGDPFGQGATAALGGALVDKGLDLNRWNADRASDAAVQRIQQDAQLAEDAGVRAVPTWFVDGYRLRGAQSDLAVSRLIALQSEARGWDTAPAGATP